MINPDRKAEILSFPNMPLPSITRWVTSRKVALLKAAFSKTEGHPTQSEICELYGISEEEWELWCNAYRKKGKEGLKVTKIQCNDP